MNRYAIIYDFDNATKINSIGRAPRQNDINRAFENSVFNLVDELCNSEMPDEIVFFVYSGWHDEVSNQYTDLYFMVHATIRDIRKSYRRVRLLFKIVDSAVGVPTAQFHHTKRTYRGIGNYKIISPEYCIDSECCSLVHVKRWVKSGCPNDNCSVKKEDAISSTGQKTVDTLMACDLMYLSSSGNYYKIIAATDDDDIVPGLIYASASNCAITWARCKYLSTYDNLLKIHSVEFIVYKRER